MADRIRAVPPCNGALRPIGFLTLGHVTLRPPVSRAASRYPSSPMRRRRSPAQARISVARPPPPPPAPVISPLIPAVAVVAAILAFGLGWTAATARQRRREKKQAPLRELPALKAGSSASSEPKTGGVVESDSEDQDFHVSASDNALWLNTSLFPR
jgi:hypothetical protein